MTKKIISELKNPFDNFVADFQRFGVLGDGVSDRERLWAIGMQMILDQYGDDQS